MNDTAKSLLDEDSASVSTASKAHAATPTPTNHWEATKESGSLAAGKLVAQMLDLSPERPAAASMFAVKPGRGRDGVPSGHPTATPGVEANSSSDLASEYLSSRRRTTLQRDDASGFRSRYARNPLPNLSNITHDTVTDNRAQMSQSTTDGRDTSTLGPEFADLQRKLAALSSSGPRSTSTSSGQRIKENMSMSTHAMELELAQLRHEHAEHASKQQEQLRVVRECLAEREQLRRSDAARQEALSKFRSEVTAAVDRLAAERGEWINEIETKSAEVAAAEAALTQANVNAESSARDLAIANTKTQQLTEEVSTLKDQLKASKIAEERGARELNMIKAELERIKAAHDEAKAKVATATNEKVTAISELKAAKRDLEAKLRQAESDAATATRDKDGLQSDFALQKARHDAEIAGLTSKLKAQCERDALAKLAGEQDKSAAELVEVRDSHRKQISQLTHRHSTELAEIRENREKEVKQLKEELTVSEQRHREEINELVWKLQETQATLKSLSATMKSRETVQSDQVARLGSELQETLRRQFASVSKVASDLANASQTLTEETRSIVDGVAAEIEPARLDLSLASSPRRFNAPAYSSSPNRSTGLADLTVASDTHAESLGFLSSSPSHDNKQFGDKGSKSLAGLASLADRELIERATANLSKSRRVLSADTESNYGKQKYSSLSAGSNLSLGHLTTKDRSLAGYKPQRSANDVGLTYAALSKASTASEAGSSPGQKGKKIRRDYEKPWLANRSVYARKLNSSDTGSIGTTSNRESTVGYIYQMLREKHEEPHANTSTSATGPSGSAKPKARVWK